PATTLTPHRTQHHPISLERDAGARAAGRDAEGLQRLVERLRGQAGGLLELRPGHAATDVSGGPVPIAEGREDQLLFVCHRGVSHDAAIVRGHAVTARDMPGGICSKRGLDRALRLEPPAPFYTQGKDGSGG